MDVVGFSKLPINDQSEILEQLNQLVRATPHFHEAEAAGKLIRLSLVGDKNRAIPRSQHLWEIPYTNFLTLALLRFDPRWDPLRGDPRFEKLAASSTPK